jgi:pyruvate dehydrogenase E2 component (dihydrolipoamide acetyltransferase)
MAEIKEALVPDIGDYSDIPVIEVLVAVGDTVKKDQGLVTLESDKATMEVPSSVAGVVKEIKVKVGDNLSEGKVVALIEVAEGEAEAKPAAAAAAAAPAAAETATKVEPVAAPAQPDKLAAREIEQAASKPTQPAPAAAAPSAGAPSSPPVQFSADSVLPQKVPYASPAVRVFARELGVDLNQLTGTEKGGRITKGDVQKFVKSALTGGVPAARGPLAARGALKQQPRPNVHIGNIFGVVVHPR